MTEWDFDTGSRGLVLRICEWGEGEVPVVVLHGFLDQGAAWAHVARALPRRVIAPDQRGQGLSGHVGAGGFYHFWDYVADVDALVRHLGGRVDLVGHSMGGTVGSLFAGLRPAAVRRLVLIEGIGPPDGGEATTLAQPRRFLDHRAGTSAHSVMADLDDAAHRLGRAFDGASPQTLRALAERTTRPVEGGRVWTWDPIHRERSPQPFDAVRFGAVLAAIEAPTLLVYGSRSWYPGSIPDLAQREARLQSARRLVLDGAGHHPHHDCPERLAAAIEEHLSA